MVEYNASNPNNDGVITLLLVIDWKATVDRLWQIAAIIMARMATILLLTTGIKEGESMGTGLLYTNNP
jgi:hypothetical protein